MPYRCKIKEYLEIYVLISSVRVSFIQGIYVGSVEGYINKY